MPDPKSTGVHCILWLSLIHFAIFVLVLRKQSSKALKYCKHTKWSKKTNNNNRKPKYTLMKTFNIMYSCWKSFILKYIVCQLKKASNTKSLLCFLKEFFFPGEGRGEKVYGMSLFNMTSVEWSQLRVIISDIWFPAVLLNCYWLSRYLDIN